VSIHVAVEHRTSYRFSRPVALQPHVVRLRPAPHCRTPVLAYSLRVQPDPHFVNWQQDPFGNHLARLVFPERATELELVVDLVADLTVINPFDFFLDESAERWPFAYGAQEARDLAPYLATDPAGKLLADWLAEVKSEPDGEATVPFLFALNRRLQGDVGYSLRFEPGVQTPEETLARAIGSCRDSAWLLVQVLRHLGLAARFASGYLIQLAADEVPIDGPAGPASDFTDLHAWAEVFVPGAGWVGLDPTSGLFAGEGHVPLACTPDPGAAAPVTGTTEPCEVAFAWSNVVRRIHEDPRVTRPYTDDAWAAIDSLGHLVDDRLTAADVRLTMGGEPTFVSVDDRESSEWTVDADGPAKREAAWTIAKRLADRFAPGALLQNGQGKWYPGEPLPRWQLGVLWRADGVPLWRDRSLLADPAVADDATPDDAHALALAIAERVGIGAEHCQPVWEDALARLAREAQLPEGDAPAIDVDPAQRSLVEPDARRRLVEQLQDTDGAPAGWVVPLHRAAASDRWTTTPWTTRRGRIVAVPGDSPLGLRLPLASLGWTPPEPDPDRSPFEPRGALPAPEAASPPTAGVAAAGEVPPTALCVERRDGRLHVFLPPVTRAEFAVELLAAVEGAAAATGRPVVVEGYPPPGDPRLRVLVVAPDPGVLEVNVHPSSSWPELVDTTVALYDEARRARLATETFGLDGTHTGTGGGNHLTLGGATPADSPVLRRPDLLRSMLTFWQHHPSLSYLFSGRFIGPTSQAPRVDEARHDSLYELEIAFAELDRLVADGEPRRWLIDRLLRHLLVDLTGNTHRAEFCIDKLFSPDTERGRLGLVELRGFEMPPHARMALVQALLVRSLVSRCWDEPYAHPLVRWGTELHDRFLLPWHVAADAAEVVDDLRAHGLPFELAWLDPFLEFRFPRLGAVEVSGVSIELRAAIEPWLVLGEEVNANATARFVDSSVERMQVLVRGLTAGRHVVCCNGRPVPLRPTSEPGTEVGGVRYRAWHPPSALHPTIDVHTPLVFDLVDTWNGRSLGGCTYHVSHPGGRSYDRFPVNANEAEARRISRFEPHGHTPGRIDLGAPWVIGPSGDGEYPRTLDLRRAPAG
jgi:uncharacterized protein (DUF2126 family)/transglutaminase-like putative cysteine protease